MLRILQVGLGPLGCKVVRDVVDRGLGRVVAALDPAHAKRPLGELVPGVEDGPTIASVPGEIADWSAIRCAIVTTGSDLELCMDTFRELLPHGIAVVSTCEELAWPWLRHPILAQELQELAVRHRSRVLGTGVNPGFLMDALPVVATTACRSVRSIRVERIQDAASRRLPFQAKIGVGLDERQFASRVQAGTLRHVGLGESLHFVAHYLGWKVERWEESIEAVTAEGGHESGLGPVRAGEARGVRQVARGWVDGALRIELVFHAALDEPDPVDRIVIQGEPPIELAIPGGVHGDVATSAIVLNTLRPLLESEPGLHTMASIPLRGCVADAGFEAR